jgi:hypothetical protein
VSTSKQPEKPASDDDKDLPPLKHLKRISREEAREFGMFTEPVSIISVVPRKASKIPRDR